MENQYEEYVIQNLTESKEESVRLSSQSGRNLLGLVPMFLLILLVVLRISWTLYRNLGKQHDCLY